MSNPVATFGHEAQALDSLSDLIQLEQHTERHLRFVPLDFLVGQLMVRVLRGQEIAEAVKLNRNETELALVGLTPEQRTLITETFHPERQQSRGAWYLPESANLKAGALSLPACFKQYGRFGSGIAKERNDKFSLANSPDGILVWSILEPLFSALFLPFEIRGHLTGTKSPEDLGKLWSEADWIMQVLGFSVDEELALMRYGGGWHRLRAPAQLEAKQRLLSSLAQQVHPLRPIRYRLFRIQQLLEQHYKKAKGKPPVTRKRVLTKAFERTLSGYFGGDWLAWLDYLGESVHPDEEIVTALPASRLKVGSLQVEALSAEHGVPAEEIQRIAATFWQQPTDTSPVEQRIELLISYWHAFDQIHAHQAPGMKSLWGLVQEYGHLSFSNHLEHYHPLLFEELLPEAMRAEIERLWGTVMLAKWPDRMVTEVFPHAVMAQALGPALRFWHGCALTAWFLTEGPYSRTDMTGLAAYSAKELERLTEWNTPIDPQFFRDLIRAEAKLGSPQRIETNVSTTELGNGISFTTSLSYGSRREGFIRLRDVISSYRRSWTEQYLADYLRKAWETEIGSAERAYNLLLTQKGKPPTLKQFAPKAVHPTNHWFGGNLSSLYAAMREKSPVEIRYEPKMPANRLQFIRQVYQHLGGGAHEPNKASETQSGLDHRIGNLANRSVWYVQLEEVLGRSPTLKEFGLDKFRTDCAALHEDPEMAWTKFCAAIEKEKADHA